MQFKSFLLDQHGKQMAKVSWNLPGDQNEVNRKPANER